VGEDADRLLHHANRMRDYLRQLPGVYDVRQDLDVGKLEYQYSLNERGRELGLNQQQLADVVRTGFLGLEAVQVSWGDERIPVRVIYLLFLGEKKEAADSMKGMRHASLIALAVIFFILASLFKSLLDPLVVMLAIPFGFIGVVVGHMLFGYHLQFLSLIGFLALTGIVVNDSLILVDFTKRLRAQGWDRVDALVEAGRVRVRPILLTTATTFLGISPLIFFATGQTAFLSPMAVSLGFGLLFATMLTLVVVPCFYLIADDLRQRVSRWMRRGAGRPAHRM